MLLTNINLEEETIYKFVLCLKIFNYLLYVVEKFAINILLSV